MSTIVRSLLPLCVMTLVVSGVAAQSKPKSNRNLITEEEIARARPNVGNAYDVVQMLRPRWLRTHEMLQLRDTDPQMAQIHVFIDDHDKGDVDFLKTIPLDVVESLQYMSTTEVGARFGPTRGPGIVVTLKR
jgi:hypothetical protein